MELRDKQVLVVGLARTGIECARFLVNQGAKVLVSDLRSETDLEQAIDTLKGLPIDYLLAGEERRWLEGMDMVVPSPGVPPTNPLLQEATSRGIEILSEIELAYRFCRFPIVAVTGTNGKSTTTTLVGEMLKANGTKVFIGGNIGAPLIGFAGDDWEWGVVEISSFQLEWIEEFRPRVAVLLNLSEDHLDRYPDFAAYCRAKERIFENQTAKDVAVLNRDDPLVWALRQGRPARIISFGFSEVDEGVFAKPEEIVWRDASSEERFPLTPCENSRRAQRGKHDGGHRRGQSYRRAGANHPADFGRISGSRASARVRQGEKRRALLQRLQGDQCRRGRQVAGEFFRTGHSSCRGG